MFIIPMILKKQFKQCPSFLCCHTDSSVPGRRLAAVFVLLLFFFSGCAAGGDIADPIVRKTQWFAYAAAKDLRAACTDGAPDRFRLIYNADYRQHLRIYDIAPDSTGLYSVRSVVYGAGNLTRFNPLDPLNPWAATVSRVAVDEPALQRLRATLSDAGAFVSGPSGLRLSSEEVYWLAASCTAGAFRYRAWKYPTHDFEALGFVPIIFGWDQTGVKPVGPERAYQSIEPAAPDDDIVTDGRFVFIVGENGLRGF